MLADYSSVIGHVNCTATVPSAFVRFFGVTETGSDIGNAFAALDERLKAGAFIKWAAWFSLDIFCEADLCEIGTGR